MDSGDGLQAFSGEVGLGSKPGFSGEVESERVSPGFSGGYGNREMEWSYSHVNRGAPINTASSK